MRFHPQTSMKRSGEETFMKTRKLSDSLLLKKTRIVQWGNYSWYLKCCSCFTEYGNCHHIIENCNAHSNGSNIACSLRLDGCWKRTFSESNLSKIDHLHPTGCSNGPNVGPTCWIRLIEHHHPQGDQTDPALDDVRPTCWIRLIYHHPARCSNGSNVGQTCWIRLIDSHPTRCSNGSSVG